MTTIAVIGGGAAGIGAARRLLAEGHEVLLIDAAARLGGNCAPLDVATDAGTLRLDVGVSDFNRVTFTEFAALLEELELPTRPIGQDASYATVDGRVVASCRAGAWWFADGVRGDTVPDEASRFRQRAVEVLHGDRFAGFSVRRYLEHIGASREFAELCLLPRAGGAFPMPDREPGSMPIRPLIEFFRMHGIVGDAPDRRCVVGGMHRYPEAFQRWFAARGGRLVLGTRVTGVRRGRGRVDVRGVDREGRPVALEVEHAVCCQHAAHALGALVDVTPVERRALQRFRVQQARVVVHTDPDVLGDDPARFGAFHYVQQQGPRPRVRPTITFHPRLLSGAGGPARDVFLTMNPHREPRPERVVTERAFVHPVADDRSHAAVAAVERLQGNGNVWFAGAHLAPPYVHESALRSGQRAADLLVRAARRGVRATA